MTKAVLENIVFCHQDESLWPFAESAHLKAIFDEMFETKQVTKVTELLWEKQKEMGKFVRENNKSQEYMKRLNDESNKRRSKALKEMEKISKESEALLPLKNKISQMKEILVVKESEQKETKAKNFIMIKKRGSLEEKASIIAKLIS